MVNAQEWLEKEYPAKKRSVIKQLDIADQKLTGSLNLSDLINLEYLNCDNNSLTGLDVSGLVKLKEIFCSNNYLTSDGLKISGLSNLEKFSGKHNLLTKIETFSSLKNLKHLELADNNFLEQDLNIFSKLTNLESLWIGNYSRETKRGIYNRFNGSLNPLNNLEKLKELEISWTDIDDGLRYLPKSLERIWYNENGRYKGYGTPKNRSSKIVDKLRNFPVGEDLKNFSEWLGQNGEKEINLDNYLNKDDNWEEKYCLCYGDSHNQVLRKWKSSLNGQYDYKTWRKDYEEQKILVEKNRLYPELVWEEKKNKTSVSKEKLPIRLYNIEKDGVEETEDNSDIKNKNYAIVSYSWGKSGIPNDINGWNTKYKDKLTPSGYKSLYKAIQTCKLKELGINYLWISEICVDQSNLEEENEEVSKMRQYYNNTYVTLVAIHADLLEELSSSRFPKKGKSEQLLLDWQNIIRVVTDSEWFSRAWTYQEGWLSKQTIFMFDNLEEVMLVDGRFLASVWALNNPSHARYNIDLKEFCEHSKKISTPLGWTYYQDGYNSEDVVSLRLDEALRETKNRKRGIPVDAIYSILGLLPYGDKVEVKYKPRICPDCPKQEEIKNCQHEEENKCPPTYNKDDVELALIEVMKVAVQNGYGEPLAWFGPRSSTKGRCWLPKVLDFSSEEASWEEKQRNGSIDIRGGIDIEYVASESEKIDKMFTGEGIKISGLAYEIISCEKIIDKVEEKSIVEGGLHRRKIDVKRGNENYSKFKMTLWGTRETLEEIKVNSDYLIIPSKNWKSNHGGSFAILASRKEKSNCFHRIDLVKLREGAEKLERENMQEIIIGMNNNTQENQQSEQKCQIQVLSKSKQ